MVTGIPHSKLVKLKYVEDFALNPQGVAFPLTYAIFSPHGLYDPDHTWTGHQPLCRDIYAQQYSRYIVYKSYIKTTFYENNNQVPIYCGTALTTGDIAFSNIAHATDIAEDPSIGKVKILPAYDKSSVTVKMSYSLKKYARTIQGGWDVLGAAVNAEPSYAFTYNVFVQQPEILATGDESMTAIPCHSEITYYVLFTGKNYQLRN